MLLVLTRAYKVLCKTTEISYVLPKFMNSIEIGKAHMWELLAAVPL